MGMEKLYPTQIAVHTLRRHVNTPRANRAFEQFPEALNRDDVVQRIRIVVVQHPFPCHLARPQGA